MLVISGLDQWKLTPAASSRSPDGGGAGSNIKAEHHAALVVFGDVTVRHPESGVCHIKQDVHGLSCEQEHGVLPDQVLFDNTILRQDDEASCAMDVERVWHWVV